MKTPTSNVLIEYDSKTWSTDLEGGIDQIKINGKNINDIHDLTCKVISMTKTIKVLAITATSLALMAVLAISFLINWLISHESSIKDLLLTSSDEYNRMLKESEAWRSHKRHRAYVTLNNVLGYQWSNENMEWEQPSYSVINLSPKSTIPQRSRRNN